LLKNIGHKLYGVNTTTKDKPIEIINMNKKKVEKVTIPKLYQEDTNQKDNVNLCQSQNQNVSKSKLSPSTIPEPSISSCVDIDFDEAELNDCSNTGQSTQAQSHNMSDTNLSLSN
jgi:hypothetical protein